MAVFDPRLSPLIEALAGAGLDWLAFEVVEGIRRGREPEESAEALKRARENAERGELQRIEADAPLYSESIPLVGDEQLHWAADYVAERLDMAMKEMATSLENIDRLAGSSRPGRPARAEEVNGTPSATIVLVDGDQQWKVGRTQVQEAASGLPELRDALSAWLSAARTGLLE